MLLRYSRKGRVVMAGAMGAAAAWQWKRRRKPAPAPAPAPGPDPAQELRARLDESRAGAPDPALPPDAPAEEAVDPAARRRSVHEEARSRIDGLKSGPEEAQ